MTPEVSKPLQALACACRVLLAAFLTALPFASKAQVPPGEIHSIDQVRALPPAQAQQKIPVHLHGVITFLDENLYSRFVQDDTAGIYLQYPVNVAPPPLVSGQIVDVIGTASPGEYAPVVLVDKITVTGQGPLPPAKPATYEQLASGAEDSQFVEIGGVVRSARKSDVPGFYEVEIVTGGGRLLIYVHDLPAARPEDMVDSSVRVRGVCSTKFNHKRQLFAIRLMVPRADDFAVETPAPQHPFDIPAHPAGSLLQFTPQESYGHRVKIAGTVTYFDPGKTMYLQDSEHGVQVETKGTNAVVPGDRVEVLGFVGQGDYTPVLQDSVYRKITADEPVKAAGVTPDNALTGNYDCELVRLTARVIDRTRNGAENYLLLQSGQAIFQASLMGSAAQDSFASVLNGSQVSVTGICRIDPGEWFSGPDWRAKSFSVLLRSPADVGVLEAPPWWTLKRVLWIAGLLGLIAIAAFGWVAVLRQKVAERTRELEIQIQKREFAERRREIEQERARVAHDLHDDLGAGLTEVNMLSSLVKSPATSSDEKSRYLGELSETARRMVTSLDEIVWAVNPRNDAIASLASYFGSYAQRLLDLASISCGLDITDDLPERPLDPKFRQEIFFAFKEALTNVVRHSHATQVWLRISVPDEILQIEVADNGQGIDHAERHAGSDGIANMKDRLKSIGGTCEILGGVGLGTTVRFRAPLPKNYL